MHLYQQIHLVQRLLKTLVQIQEEVGNSIYLNHGDKLRTLYYIELTKSYIQIKDRFISDNLLEPCQAQNSNEYTTGNRLRLYRKWYRKIKVYYSKCLNCDLLNYLDIDVKILQKYLNKLEKHLKGKVKSLEYEIKRYSRIPHGHCKLNSIIQKINKNLKYFFKF